MGLSGNFIDIRDSIPLPSLAYLEQPNAHSRSRLLDLRKQRTMDELRVFEAKQGTHMDGAARLKAIEEAKLINAIKGNSSKTKR